MNAKKKQKQSEKWQKLYDTVYDAHPNIKDDEHIEQLVRKKVLHKRLLTAVILYGLCIVFWSVYRTIPQTDSLLLEGVSLLFHGGSIFCGLVSVFRFARTLHDPLTPNEQNGDTSYFRYQHPASKAEPEPHYTLIEREKPTSVSKTAPDNAGHITNTTSANARKDYSVHVCVNDDNRAVLSEEIAATAIRQHCLNFNVVDFIIPLVFSLPVFVFLPLMLFVHIGFIIGVLGFGFFGIIFFSMLFVTEKDRRHRLKHATANNILFRAYTCSKKRIVTEADDETNVKQTRYRVACDNFYFDVPEKTYYRIKGGDTLLFAYLCNETDPLVAFIAKEWTTDHII